MKITCYNDEFLNKHLSNIVFIEGHFESYKYFDDLRFYKFLMNLDFKKKLYNLIFIMN